VHFVHLGALCALVCSFGRGQHLGAMLAAAHHRHDAAEHQPAGEHEEQQQGQGGHHLQVRGERMMDCRSAAVLGVHAHLRPALC